MASERDTGSEPPGLLVPALRCAVEMLAVAGIFLLVGLPASNTVYLGVVVALTVIAVTVVLFWCLNRQMRAWIVHAQRSGMRRARQTD
ncbi:hypothetical protein BRD09_05415 [Halobacteriales archaeon SW_10_68_16]|jgi:hypothetical protein|nr:MAG: hypothetical protein BRD09_05415 [Halobacteriales archaeon SW_10_68_16]